MKTKQFRALLFIYGLVAGLVLGLVAGFMLRTFWAVPSPEFTIISENTLPGSQAPSNQRRSVSSNPLWEVESAADTISSDSLGLSNELVSADTSAFTGTAINGDDIILATDQLLYSLVIVASGDTASIPVQGKNLDSLLIGDKGSYPLPNKYKVEFWRSPINYKGYRLQKDRLVLYGIEYFEDATLKKVDGKLFLSVGMKTYALEESPEYKPLISTKMPSYQH